MVELSEAQRRIIVDKVPDMANVAAGGMVFGQFLADRPFSIAIAAAGMATWAVMGVFTLILAGRSKS